MFTGIVETVADVVAVHPEPPGSRLVLAAPVIAAETTVGESIAVNGCCLTIVRRDVDRLEFQAGPETLARTNLGELQPGGQVNLERALRLSDRLGGHLLTGHIDGVGTVDQRLDEGAWSTIWFRVSSSLTRQMAAKGSVAIDGASLTLVAVEERRFSVQLIPHTLAVTTLGRRRAGDRVNIETDLLAKYVERQLAAARNDQ
ncbi:MAG: riboflavin synthase [Pirellulales bacterium]